MAYTYTARTCVGTMKMRRTQCIQTRTWSSAIAEGCRSERGRVTSVPVHAYARVCVRACCAHVRAVRACVCGCVCACMHVCFRACCARCVGAWVRQRPVRSGPAFKEANPSRRNQPCTSVHECLRARMRAVQSRMHAYIEARARNRAIVRASMLGVIMVWAGCEHECERTGGRAGGLACVHAY